MAVSTRRFTLDGTCASAVQGDGMQLPFRDASFDFVWSWGMLPHVPGPASLLGEVHRVLKPGGELRLMTYNRRSVYNWLGIIARYGVLRLQLLHHSVPELWRRYSDGREVGGSPFVRYYSASELHRALQGFDVLEMRAFEQKTTLTSFLPRSLRRVVEARISDGLMRLLFEKLGMLLYCRARRPPGSTPASVPLP